MIERLPCLPRPGTNVRKYLKMFFQTFGKGKAIAWRLPSQFIGTLNESRHPALSLLAFELEIANVGIVRAATPKVVPGTVPMTVLRFSKTKQRRGFPLVR